MIKIRIFIVCQWPLGGIRAYLKYNYRDFPSDQFAITILENPSIEKESMPKDTGDLGIELNWALPVKGSAIFWDGDFERSGRERPSISFIVRGFILHFMYRYSTGFATFHM